MWAGRSYLPEVVTSIITEEKKPPWLEQLDQPFKHEREFLWTDSRCNKDHSDEVYAALWDLSEYIVGCEVTDKGVYTSRIEPLSTPVLRIYSLVLYKSGSLRIVSDQADSFRREVRAVRVDCMVST